jgi:hypothetical protein
MKQLIVLAAACLLSAFALAQKEDSKDYAKMKEEVATKIFGTSDPYFKDNALPDQYKNESAVVLAQKHSIESDSKFKFRFGLFSHSGAKFSFFDIFRKKILINDHAALQEFSQLNFEKLESKNWSPLGKLKNYTFINIRLIKPNGTIKTIDVDESAVTLRNEKDQKTNKIAIPDLGVGDIIDYYVCNYYQEGEGGRTPLIYVLGDDYPIINYVISLQFDARISAEYQAINGAPDFKISPDEDGGGNILFMVVKNVPKIKGLMWSSPYRQLPIIRLNYLRGSISRRDMPDIREGRVEKATTAYSDMVETNLAAIMNDVCYSGAVSTHLYKSDRSEVKSAWKKYIDKYPKANNPDSIAPFVFRYINWADYFSNSFSLTTDYNSSYFPQELQTQLYRIAKFGYIMQLEFKTDIQLLVLPGRDSYTRENSFSPGDLSVLVSTMGSKPQYFSFADNLDYSGAIPSNLQGEKAKAYPFDTKQLIGGKLLYVHLKEGSLVSLPSTDNAKNRETEVIEARTDESDPQLMVVKRKVTDMGYLKRDNQMGLIIYEELAEQAGSGVGITDGLLDQNKERGKSTRNSEEELKSLLEKARSKSKEYFENEIKQNYGTKAKELKSHHVLNFGASAEAPFEFEEEFVMEGWVKKAGNNYIVDIGKLVSSQLAIDKDQRERIKDVYMPFPRSFSYHLELMIPEGYTAEGLDKINSKTENETGAFISSGKMEGNKLVIDIQKFYLHTWEPSARWPLLLNFLDKAIEFGQTKILLKKK